MADVNYSCLFIICHLFLIMSGVMILQYKLGTFLFISGIMFAFFDSVYYLMIKNRIHYCDKDTILFHHLSFGQYPEVNSCEDIYFQ